MEVPFYFRTLLERRREKLFKNVRIWPLFYVNPCASVRVYLGQKIAGVLDPENEQVSHALLGTPLQVASQRHPDQKPTSGEMAPQFLPTVSFPTSPNENKRTYNILILLPNFLPGRTFDVYLLQIVGNSSP